MKALPLSSKHQVVIPKEARIKMGLTEHDSLIVEKVTKDRLVLKKQPSYYDFLGITKPRPEDPVKRVRKLRDNWR